MRCSWLHVEQAADGTRSALLRHDDEEHVAAQAALGGGGEGGATAEDLTDLKTARLILEPLDADEAAARG
jgi:hypothetical protein